jgi:deoxyadenosine/deoxycytidine kinase
VIIALEGLPGAGKTTSAVLLGERLDAGVVCETTQDHPFLSTVYDDQARHDLQVELAFLLLHSAAYREISVDRNVVTDFSPVKDLLFAADMLAEPDLALFESVYHQLYSGQSIPSLVAYLDVSPEVCMDRVRRRLSSDGRRSFEQGLELVRLQRMQERYEARLSDLGERVLRLPIPAELSETQVADQLVELLAAACANPDASVSDD